MANNKRGTYWWERFPENSRRFLFFRYCNENRIKCISIVVFILAVVFFSCNSVDDNLNSVYWLTGSIFILLLASSLTFYVIYYLFFFRWYEHSGGRLIMQLISAFEGLVLLTVLRNLMIMGGFIEFPYGTLVWWPLMRMAIYGVLSYTVIRIDVTLVFRFRRAQRLEFSVEPRNPRTGPTLVPDSQIPVSPTSLPPGLEITFTRPRKSRTKK
jgi:hypothetical protein